MGYKLRRSLRGEVQLLLRLLTPRKVGRQDGEVGLYRVLV